MHIQQKHFPNTQTPQKILTQHQKNSTPTNPRNVKHLFNHKAHYLPNATNSISATKNTTPTTHHNTKLYIIYIMRLLCAALCTCTPTIKKYMQRTQTKHTHPFFITHHKVRPSPNPSQNKPHIHAHTTTKTTLKNSLPITTTSPTSPRATIHNTKKT